MNRTSSPKLSNAKFDCTIVTGSSRRTKRIYHMYTSELGWKRYAQDKITPLTSRGPSGIHIRPHGDTLPLWMPCVHYISSIQKKHSLTNQTMPRVQHKDLWAHNLCKPPQNNVYTWNRQNGPHVSLPEKAQRERRPNWFGRTLGSTEPTLRQIILAFNVAFSYWFLNQFQRCLLVFLNLDAKLWVPSNDVRNNQMVILTITRVRKRTEVPL
jgi:hypothetical protein